MKRYLDVKGAAEYLGLTEEAMRSRYKRRQIPFYKLGNRVLFDIGDLDKCLIHYPSVEMAVEEIGIITLESD